MKRIFTISLVIVMALSICACSGIHMGASTGEEDLKDLAIKAVSPTTAALKARDQKFAFTVEVDPDTVVTDHVVYDWYVRCSEDGEHWWDVAWLTTGNNARYSNNRPVFDETVCCGTNSNTDTPLSFGDVVEAGLTYKITCCARDYFPGYDTSPRQSSAMIDFFVTVSEDLPD